MLSRWRSNPQPTLLERYWMALRRNAAATPPAGLDPDLASLAQQLSADVERLDPPSAVVAELRDRLMSSTATNNHRPRDWSGPAIDLTQQRRNGTRAIKESEERVIMSDITTTGEPVTTPQRRWTREILKIAAAIAVFAVIGLVLAMVLRDDDDEPEVAVPVPTETPVASAVPTQAVVATATSVTVPPTATALAESSATPPESTATPPPSPTVVEMPTGGSVEVTIPVGQWPSRMSAGAGSIWVTNSNDGSVGRIDPSSNAVIATIQVASPGNNTADALAADDTSVWVYAAPRTLVRIDPATNQVEASIALDAAVDWLAIGHGSVWALGFDANQLMRIDPATNTITASIPVEDPRDIVVTSDAVWVLRGVGESDVLKIDPATFTVIATISLEGAYGEFLRADGETLWVSTKDGLIPIDATIGQLAPTVPYPAPIFAAPMIAVGDGKVWVCRCMGQDAAVVWQFETSTGKWTAQIPIGTPARDTWLLFSDDALWMSHSDDNTVVRITPAE